MDAVVKGVNINVIEHAARSWAVIELRHWIRQSPEASARAP